MEICNFYEFKNESYLCVRMVRTVSGFWVSSDIMVKFSKFTVEPNDVIGHIKNCLGFEIVEKVPDPTDWKKFRKDFLQRSGLKSMKDLDRETTKLCSIEAEFDIITFIPFERAIKPDKGYTMLSEKKISKKISDDNLVLYDALQITLNNC